MDDLIRRCLDGDTHACADLYKRWCDSVYRLAYGILRQAQDAEEVTQDVFVYAFKRLATYDSSKSAFRTWLYTITISRSRNRLRRKWLPTLQVEEWEEKESQEISADRPSEVWAESQAERERVWSAVGQLSPKLREAVVLRYFENLTYPEIGQILGCPMKTIQSRVRLAHKELRKLLSDQPSAVVEQVI
jgi:RNA polymerase sigma-70 factor (ECF subfamily)